jgi:hypothetical protein
VLAIRRQRSLVVAGTAMAVLVVIVLFLLYKTGRHVTTLSTAQSSVGGVDPPPQPAVQNTIEPPAVRPAETSSAVGPSTAGSPAATSTGSKAGPSGLSAPRAKPSSQTIDIFRKPAF